MEWTTLAIYHGLWVNTSCHRKCEGGLVMLIMLCLIDMHIGYETRYV
jgi:hypothetical protein